MAAHDKLKDDLVRAIPSLRAFALSLCGNAERADDLVQETLMKAWANLSSFVEGTNLSAWLFTILRNAFYSDFRKRRREIEDADGQMAGRLASMPAQNGHSTHAASSLEGMERKMILEALDSTNGHQQKAAAKLGNVGLKTRLIEPIEHLMELPAKNEADHHHR